MMDKWEKFNRLTSGELWFLIRALCLLPLVTLGLRLKGFKSMQSTLANRLPVGDVSIDQKALSQAYVIARMVKVAAVHGLCRATCLPQSLVLWWLLQRRGIGSDLRFGVQRAEDRLEAHAWVEVDGVPVNDTEDVRQRFNMFSDEVKEY